MPDLLQRGLARLTQILKDRCSQSVTYHRDGRSITVNATFGQKLLKLDNGLGTMYLEWTDMDFLIPTEDLVIDSVAFTPERGDLIDLPFSTKTERFEVTPYGGDAAYRYSDPNQTIVRVHTKHVETLEPI